MTTRLRAGFFVDSKMKEDKQYYFGYITHAGLDYDVAISFPINKLKKYLVTDRTQIDHEGINYKLGLIQTFEDNNGIDVYLFKAFIDGKLVNLIVYPSDYQELVKLGHHINTYQNSLVLESFVNLNQES
jgi:hypothetical protein